MLGLGQSRNRNLKTMLGYVWRAGFVQDSPAALLDGC